MSRFMGDLNERVKPIPLYTPGRLIPVLTPTYYLNPVEAMFQRVMPHIAPPYVVPPCIVWPPSGIFVRYTPTPRKDPNVGSPYVP
jgi:hypothetical protein